MLLKQQKVLLSPSSFFLVCLVIHVFEKRELMDDDDAQTQILGPVMRALGL